ncbi:MAG: hypothetical protein ACFFGZ_10950 [Candidatus Thorarchaeota archaeon]
MANGFARVTLETAIRAMQDPAARLRKPATIPPNQVTELLVRVFGGRTLAKGKMGSLFDQANVKIPGNVLQDALDRLVQQGKVIRQEREESKIHSRRYTLYSFRKASLKSEAMAARRLNDLLKQFGGEAFELRAFLQKAEKNQIPREQAHAWFDQQRKKGFFFEFAHKRFRRVL